MIPADLQIVEEITNQFDWYEILQTVFDVVLSCIGTVLSSMGQYL